VGGERKGRKGRGGEGKGWEVGMRREPPTLKCRFCRFFSQNRHKRPVKKPKLHQKAFGAGGA